MPNPTTTAAPAGTETAADTLMLTCRGCQRSTYWPLTGPVAFECTDAACGGWAFTAELVCAQPALAALGEPRAAGDVLPLMAVPEVIR